MSRDLESSKRAKFKVFSTFELPPKMDKSHGYHMECYRNFTALSKAQREKLDCLKNTRTDSSNNTNSLSGFQDACSSMIKRSDIKSPKPSNN